MTGTSPKVVGVWAAIGILAVQGWRVYKRKQSGNVTGDNVKSLFAAFGLAIVVSFVADLNANLGAVFGLAVIIGLMPGGSGNVAGIFTGTVDSIAGSGGVARQPGSVGTPTPRRGGV